MQANRTFDSAFRFIEVAANFSSDNYYTLYDYLNNSANIEFLRVGLHSFTKYM